MKKTGAEIIVNALVQENVDILFAYPGGVVIPIFDVLYDIKEITVILTRHEQAAAHAADGYARATGKVGVCLSTSGPGATNLVTGIATAYLDSIPLVAITGQVSVPLLGTDAFQEADMVGISRPITKHNFLVKTVEELPVVFKKAFHIAGTGRPGPVLIDIPVNVSKSIHENYVYPSEITIRSYKPNFIGHVGQIKKAAAAIQSAKKPLLYTGGGIIISDSHTELLAFAEKTNIPVTTTLMGLGGFPGTHRLFLGMPGMHGTKAANYCLQNTDLIISIGVRFDDRVTGNVDEFAPHAKIIHMDIDPAAISKTIEVDIPVVGDAKNILNQLNTIIIPGDYTEWKQQVSQWKEVSSLTYTALENEIKPQKVIEAIYAETKGDAVIATEVGQNQMWTAHYYRFNKPRSFLSSGGLGTMGYGMPAAMGASLGLGKPVIDIAGDGSIQMNIQELATISLNNIPVKIVILNNGYLGMVRQWQELFFNKRYSSTCLRSNSVCTGCEDTSLCKKKYIPDFIALAHSYQIPAFRAEKPSEIVPVLREGLAIHGPALMEFMVTKEENVFPMVPASKPLDQILEEK